MGIPIYATSITNSNSIKNRKIHISDDKDSNALICCTWKIRRGLLTKEKELREILNSEKVDIIFLTETDTKMLLNEESYKIQGYKTYLPLKKENCESVRILCLVNEAIVPVVSRP